jgi:hypothetical protein
MKQWQVLLNFENVWHENNEPMTFATEEEAEAELIAFFKDCEEAVKMGYMDDAGYDDDYRIVRMK